MMGRALAMDINKLRTAVQRTREDLGFKEKNYPDIRILLEFAETAIKHYDEQKRDDLHISGKLSSIEKNRIGNTQ